MQVAVVNLENAFAFTDLIINSPLVTKYTIKIFSWTEGWDSAPEIMDGLYTASLELKVKIGFLAASAPLNHWITVDASAHN